MSLFRFFSPVEISQRNSEVSQINIVFHSRLNQFIFEPYGKEFLGKMHADIGRAKRILHTQEILLYVKSI